MYINPHFQTQAFNNSRIKHNNILITIIQAFKHQKTLKIPNQNHKTTHIYINPHLQTQFRKSTQRSNVVCIFIPIALG